MVKTNKGEPSIFTNLRRFVAGGAWVQDQGPETSRGALAAALRNRGGAKATPKKDQQRPTRGRSRPVEVESSGASTTSTSATSASSATSKERRNSWAPSAGILAEQVGGFFQRSVEAARGNMKLNREVKSIPEAEQRLRQRLQEWCHRTAFQGASPRLTSMYPVDGYTWEVRMVWRGIEMILHLGPSKREPEFAILDAHTDFVDLAETLTLVVDECFQEPVEVFMDSLLPDELEYEDDTISRTPFEAFVNDRPPTHRFMNTASQNLAWEWPLTRAEKLEWFLANTLAQEELNDEQEEAERRTSRRWSRGRP